ncbi:MAG: carbamoyl phosphate synthase small subunit [Sarcina sp.]|nr:carbamoyl phosphate synthase small subunit [Sarcina sp.]
MKEKIRRKIILEDGREFYGYAFGSLQDRVCEIVFNTSMAGYQEILSDLSYTDQAVVMTYPLIGNYGMAAEDYESSVPSIGAMIVREYNDEPSNFRSRQTLGEVMEKNGIPGITGVDTRALTRSIRDYGTRKALLTDASMSTARGLEILQETVLSSDAVSRVSCRQRWESPPLPAARDLGGGASHRTGTAPALLSASGCLGGGAMSIEDLSIAADQPGIAVSRAAAPSVDAIAGSQTKKALHVAAIDCGIKRNIIRSLNRLGCHVTIVPWNTGADEIRSLCPDGILISNGPGDPTDVPETIAAVRSLLGSFPVFGICLGHQILSLAYGARTYKLKFGHRGGNHPVKNLTTGKIEITSQNHSYAIEGDSISATPLKATHINLLDQTIEGVECAADNAFGVQYHPESAPGPQDSAYLFSKFLKAMRG